LLRELEAFNGVVIFATNLAANFDPAFERRIRAHVRFEMPGVEEREEIWKVQIHPSKTPLARDVDFQALAGKFAVSGGDIKNAVLKAAAAAAAGPGAERTRQIHQEHFERAMADVMAAREVMQQSLFRESDPVIDAIRRMERRMYMATIVAATSLFAALIALAIVLLR
jgi:SpoVK/Ycf46/Vps4 family AAA+-type ATPase